MTRDLANIRVTKVSLVEVRVNGLLRWTLKNLVIEYEITNVDDLKRIIQTEKTNQRTVTPITNANERGLTHGGSIYIRGRNRYLCPHC